MDVLATLSKRLAERVEASVRRQQRALAVDLDEVLDRCHCPPPEAESIKKAMLSYAEPHLRELAVSEAVSRVVPES